ncbi:MAG TPA: GNAT family N-acetyltransferase [Patescibacteria group bacterium]|nr:GNAT family N-acetyltransferase [Patescibacteria group bacterium]
MNIKIKTAKSSDWKLIQKLNNEVFLNDEENDDDLDLDWPFSEKGIDYYQKLASGKYGKCYIAYLGKIPVGYVALAIKNFGYRKSKYVEIENIGVNPEYRSQGIGKLLVDASVRWAKEQKATKLFVSAYWNSKRAINFYKKNGFYEIGIELDRKI